VPPGRRPGRLPSTSDSPPPSAAFISEGRLTTIPREAARREQLLHHLAETLFAPDRTSTEPEVNDLLRTVHDDCPALRRHLVEAALLTRLRDGSAYRRRVGPSA
jgi:hypothetical protein